MSPLVLASPLAIRPSPIALIVRREAGLGAERAIRRGDLVRLVRGVYVRSDRWRALPPWDRYLARVHAVALVRRDAVFSGESAAALWGLPSIGEPAEVHVLTEHAGSARVTDGIRSHASEEARDVRSEGGLLLLSPEEAAVDIARSRHPGVALMAADAAARLTGVTADRLLALNERRASSRGRRAARWALSRANPLAETALESVSRAAVEWLGFPDPELQHVFSGPEGEEYRGDMYWEAERVLGEADGRTKYDGTHGDGAQALLREKRREDFLRRRVDGMARWMWTEVRAYPRLRDVLRHAGLREIRPTQTGPLHTLRAAISVVRRETSSAARDIDAR